MAGKTARGKAIVDKWLMEHPYMKAHIIDGKTGQTSTRVFIPNPQLKEGDTNGSERERNQTV